MNKPLFKSMYGATLALAMFLMAPTGMTDSLSNSLAIGLGPGLSVRPDYLGSNSYQVRPTLLMEARWRNRIYFSSREEELLLNLLGDGPQLGTRFSYWQGRDRDANPAVAALRNYSANPTGGLFFNYRQGPISTQIQVDRDLGGDRQGTTASLSVRYRAILSHDLRLRFGSYLTWADENYMDAMFGIRAFEANRSSLYDDAYGTDAGLRDIRFDLLMDYSLSRNWNLIGRVDYAHLLGDAADSPMVAKEGSKHQFYTSIGAIYLW